MSVGLVLRQRERAHYRAKSCSLVSLQTIWFHFERASAMRYGC